jgi:hypothetical protein
MQWHPCTTTTVERGAKIQELDLCYTKCITTRRLPATLHPFVSMHHIGVMR